MTCRGTQYIYHTYIALLKTNKLYSCVHIHSMVVVVVVIIPRVLRLILPGGWDGKAELVENKLDIGDPINRLNVK
jgi:hypothetical protein